MTKHHITKTRATRKPVIVLAGEDANDRSCLRIAIEAALPDARGRLVDINEQVRLHQATGANLRTRVDKIARLAEARAAREKSEIAAVFVHEDYDAVDSTERAGIRQRVQDVLSARLGSAHYVLATWEVEAWLLLFPEAVSSFHGSWSVPQKYLGRDTARLQDPKRIMINEVARKPRYRESDAPQVLRKASELDLLQSPVGRNCSWQELAAHITSIASRLTPDA